MKLQEIYSRLFVQMMLARNAEDILTSEASIADYAVAPALHFRPRKLIVVGLALLTTMIFSVLVAGVAARLDNQIRNLDDIHIPGLRALGILPKFETVFRMRNILHLIHKPSSTARLSSHDALFTEAVNTVRTTLTHSNDTLQTKILLITSSLPGEGKSSAAINLAHSFSRNNERVLLIDCDMRKPAIAIAAGFSKRINGLSSIFEIAATLSGWIVTGAFNNAFDIVLSGPVSERPLELISSRHFSTILD